jgi:hypothetical protein
VVFSPRVTDKPALRVHLVDKDISEDDPIATVIVNARPCALRSRTAAKPRTSTFAAPAQHARVVVDGVAHMFSAHEAFDDLNADAEYVAHWCHHLGVEEARRDDRGRSDAWLQLEQRLRAAIASAA